LLLLYLVFENIIDTLTTKKTINLCHTL